MSRFKLHLRTSICRCLQTLGRWCDNYLSFPLPQSPSFTCRISSTVGSRPGNFDVLVYGPLGYGVLKDDARQDFLPKKLPLLINFHGGGYTIGGAADDARWATAVISRTPCVVASVDYRLAPAYGFPTGIEDCVSTILYLWSHASEYNLDISRTALSGFSAGGNFCFTVPFRLHQELERLSKNGQEEPWMRVGKLVALAPFYPAVDWSRTREQRAATNPNVKPLMPGLMHSLFFGLFDDAYLYPRPPDLKAPLLSPGLAPEEMLKEQLPQNVVMVTCSGDALLMEGEEMRTRLEKYGKDVRGGIVEGVAHGWDKWPTWTSGNGKRDECYASTADSLAGFWGV